MPTTSPLPPDAAYRGTAFVGETDSSKGLSLGRRARDMRRRFYGLGLRCCFWALPKLPLWSLSLLTRATAAPLMRRRYWRRAEQQLVKVYGDELSAEERKRILIEVFDSMRAILFECIGVIGRGPDSYLRRIDDTEVKARIEALERQSPKGWIGVSGHLGNWILLASWASSLPGRGKCHAMAKRQPNPHLNAILEDVHDSLHLEAIYSDGPPVALVAKVIKELRSGTRLGIVPDQDTPRLPGVFIDFLGHQAYTATGPAQLALAANVPLLPIALVRKGAGFKVIGGVPIYPDRTRPRSEEILRLTRAWSERLEQMIQEHPGQWIWIHRRWRTTPAKLAAKGREQLATEP